MYSAFSEGAPVRNDSGARCEALISTSQLWRCTVLLKAKYRCSVALRARLALWALLLSYVTFPVTPRCQERPTRRILVLNEVGTSYPLINLVDQGIRSAVESSPFGVEIYRESMDTVLFPDPVSQKLIREFLTQKYKKVDLDAIVTVGSAPLKYVADVHESAFPGVPVIYCFPNGVEQSLQAGLPFTGVEDEIMPASTINAALKLLPDTKRVVVVGGMASFDRQQQKT